MSGMNAFEFLTARLDDEEQVARILSTEDLPEDLRRNPDAALREIRAKRAVLSLCDRPGPGDYWQGWDSALEQVLQALASAYSDHPDYKQEWNVD